jgi:hypothetical protein
MDILQEAFRIPNRYDQKRIFPHHIIIKMPRVQNKERILKAAREKLFTSYLQRQTHHNCFRPLSRDSKNQEIMG